MSGPLGVLLMSYGSPASRDEVEPYYSHIRGGRRPSPELLEELTARYQRIGWRSPLLEVMDSLARGVEARLNQLSLGPGYRVAVGMRHWRPFIDEAVQRMKDAGVARIIAIAVAPHYSRMSVGAYMDSVRGALAKNGLQVPLAVVERWGSHPLFLRLMASQVRSALEGWQGEETIVLFTAHSLPERIRTWGDTYERELMDSASEVAQLVGLEQWQFAFQSQSRTGEPWLGPELMEVLRDIAKEKRYPNVLVCPIGFLIDNLETLYDLDVLACEEARRIGLGFRRVPCPNSSPLLMETLTTLAVEAALRPWGGVPLSTPAPGPAKVDGY